MKFQILIVVLLDYIINSSIIFYIILQKTDPEKSAASTRSSTVLRTEWLPVNVMPKRIPADMLQNNNREPTKRPTTVEENEELWKTRSNPFLSYDTELLEKRLVSFIYDFGY